ncbi:uncharacterized protein LOC116192095 isoform X1 [Punica granatum]|uniref:Uncharacterized protein LOC116192095 isoform X1 n=1 Tax=Punica granatum TaxID=22663 RepID=A0A6P8C1B0_PUNGR|nr:uncharacterized protein LOC116192095 isoform X1 [Punica granatum]
MSLTSVKMSEEVWLTCLTHALSTETEEIMGLLLGDIESSKNGNLTALIWGASPQTRSDRQKDRVETNPEQLAAASAQAERMTISTGRMTRVIGWYHSHPHITVLPSHVDVRTQAMYQLLDSGFIGLIFSCFSEDSNKVGRIQIIAFQSSDGKQARMSVKPIPLSPVNRNSVIDLESSLSSSENTSIRSGSTRGENLEEDTGDSRASKGRGRSTDLGGFFANADATYLGREIIGGKFHNENSGSTSFIDIDPMDMSEGMQEAMHRSNLDMRARLLVVDSGADYVRKEVPLYVLPSSSLLKLDSPLSSFTDLQRVIYEEEKAAYFEAMGQNIRNGKAHPLTFIHHTSTYQASMCKLIEHCLSPAISALHDCVRDNEIRAAKLTEERKNLEMEVLHRSDPILSSTTSHNVRGAGSSGFRSMYGSSEVSGAVRNVGSPCGQAKRGS